MNVVNLTIEVQRAKAGEVWLRLRGIPEGHEAKITRAPDPEGVATIAIQPEDKGQLPNPTNETWDRIIDDRDGRPLVCVHIRHNSRALRVRGDR